MWVVVPGSKNCPYLCHAALASVRPVHVAGEPPANPWPVTCLPSQGAAGCQGPSNHQHY